jgi:hypothetical protein
MTIIQVTRFSEPYARAIINDARDHVTYEGYGSMFLQEYVEMWASYRKPDLDADALAKRRAMVAGNLPRMFKGYTQAYVVKPRTDSKAE